MWVVVKKIVGVDYKIANLASSRGENVTPHPARLEIKNYAP
jgi:hypothetical protein